MRLWFSDKLINHIWVTSGLMQQNAACSASAPQRHPAPVSTRARHKVKETLGKNKDNFPLFALCAKHSVNSCCSYVFLRTRYRRNTHLSILWSSCRVCQKKCHFFSRSFSMRWEVKGRERDPPLKGAQGIDRTCEMHLVFHGGSAYNLWSLRSPSADTWPVKFLFVTVLISEDNAAFRDCGNTLWHQHVDFSVCQNCSSIGQLGYGYEWIE